MRKGTAHHPKRIECAMLMHDSVNRAAKYSSRVLIPAERQHFSTRVNCLSCNFAVYELPMGTSARSRVTYPIFVFDKTLNYLARKTGPVHRVPRAPTLGRPLSHAISKATRSHHSTKEIYISESDSSHHTDVFHHLVTAYSIVSGA